MKGVWKNVTIYKLEKSIDSNRVKNLTNLSVNLLQDYNKYF